MRLASAELGIRLAIHLNRWASTKGDAASYEARIIGQINGNFILCAVVSIVFELESTIGKGNYVPDTHVKLAVFTTTSSFDLTEK